MKRITLMIILSITGALTLSGAVPEEQRPSLDTTLSMTATRQQLKVRHVPSIYELPYSLNLNVPDHKRLWRNTAVLAGAFVSTLLVLECLPENATDWNRTAIREVPPLKRWFTNVFKRGPRWDHDLFIFNYVLHPYAGAAYFMAARSCGYNFWRSFLYSALISNIGWEFGAEAFMERPSYQDLIITPCVGSILGEGFYRLKRHIVDNGYELAGSKLLGNIAAFIADPVNEVIDIFSGNPAREYSARQQRRVSSSLMPAYVNGAPGFTFTCRF